MFNFVINLPEVSFLYHPVCRIVYTARPGAAAVDGVGSDGDVVSVCRMSVTAAETVCLLFFVRSVMYNYSLSLFSF